MGRRSHLIAFAILVASVAGVVYYAFPGFASWDTYVQLLEARSGRYTDWHPAAMAAIWRKLELVVPGTLGMLLLQLGCFTAGVYLLARRVLAPVAAAVFTLGLTWFPPISTTLAVIWKDSQMLGFLALGTALMLRDRRSLRLVGIGLMVLASLMRHNAFTITGPLIVLLFVWSPCLPTWRRYALSVSVWVAVTIAGLGINRVLTDEHLYPWHGSVAVFDVGGIIKYAPPLSDEELRVILAGAPVVVNEKIQYWFGKAYRSRDGQFAYLNRNFIRIPQNADERAGIERAFTTLITTYPGAYLEHRTHAFIALLGIGTDAQNVWVGVDHWAQALFPDHPGPLRQWMREQALWLGQTWLFRAVVYLVLVVVALGVAIRRRDRVSIALLSSSILAEISLFFLAPTPDFRYSIWLVPAAAFGILRALRRDPQSAAAVVNTDT